MSEQLLKEHSKLLEGLRNKGCRITKQKKCVVSAILQNPDASCKELCFLVKKCDNDISHTTVYRTIKQLEELGFIHCQRGIKVLGA